jgi:hypothetical protein
VLHHADLLIRLCQSGITCFKSDIFFKFTLNLVENKIVASQEGPTDFNGSV